MKPASKLVKACAQLAWLAETLSEHWPEGSERRRAHLQAMRERLGEIEALCPEASARVVDPTGTDPLVMGEEGCWPSAS